MARVEWEIEGPSYGNCNCDWGCPCQFNKLPTHGNCEAMGSMRIEKGHYGDVSLDGLCWINTFKWPGAVHEGNGTFQSFIDERANEDQRHALAEILYGRAEEEGASFLSVFASTMTKLYDPVFAAIELEIDIEKRTARANVPGVIASTGEPMKNPFSDDTHDARLILPNGMEFIECFCGSGTTKATGDVALDHADTWGHFAMYHFNQDGIIR